MKSKKIAIVVNGVKVELPAEVIRMRNDGTTPYIYGSPVVAGKIVKSYVKSKYPNILVWTKYQPSSSRIPTPNHCPCIKSLVMIDSVNQYWLRNINKVTKFA